MSWWDSKTGTIRSFEPMPVEGYPDWRCVDCGCCNGVEWGGESPRECRRCGESGHLFLHIPSGVTASYPGGPLLGRLSADEVRRELKAERET